MTHNTLAEPILRAAVPGPLTDLLWSTSDVVTDAKAAPSTEIALALLRTAQSETETTIARVATDPVLLDHIARTTRRLKVRRALATNAATPLGALVHLLGVAVGGKRVDESLLLGLISAGRIGASVLLDSVCPRASDIRSQSVWTALGRAVVQAGPEECTCAFLREVPYLTEVLTPMVIQGLVAAPSNRQGPVQQVTEELAPAAGTNSAGAGLGAAHVKDERYDLGQVLGMVGQATAMQIIQRAISSGEPVTPQLAITLVTLLPYWPNCFLLEGKCDGRGHWPSHNALPYYGRTPISSRTEQVLLEAGNAAADNLLACCAGVSHEARARLVDKSVHCAWLIAGQADLEDKTALHILDRSQQGFWDGGDYCSPLSRLVQHPRCSAEVAERLLDTAEQYDYSPEELMRATYNAKSERRLAFLRENSRSRLIGRALTYLRAEEIEELLVNPGNAFISYQSHSRHGQAGGPTKASLQAVLETVCSAKNLPEDFKPANAVARMRGVLATHLYGVAVCALVDAAVVEEVKALASTKAAAEIFLKLAVSWEGSIRELVATANDLSAEGLKSD